MIKEVNYRDMMVFRPKIYKSAEWKGMDMDNEKLKDYTARITQANRSELVVIMYEIILSDFEEAQKAHKNQDVAAFKKCLYHAQRFVNELICTLDYKYVLSLDLMQLYLYVNRQITKANLQKNTKPIQSARDVMGSLLVGFEGVAREDNSKAVMRHTQQLYAGLTYGKGVLNEAYFDPREQTRGFKA